MSNYGFYVTSTSKSGSAMPDNKGVLQYKIDCASDKSNFVVNTLLRNSGVTKADGTAITASDVNGKISTDALQIKGGENFFKETGGSDLAKFSLSADAEVDSELATEMKKLEYCNVDGVASANYTKFYYNWNGSTFTDNSYYGKLRNDSLITVDDLKEIKAEAERLIPIAENCVEALGDDASEELKTLLDYAKRFNNSVTLNAAGTGFDLSLQVPDGITSTISDNDKNKGKLLFASIDSSTHVVQRAVYIAIDNSSKLTAIRASEDYKQIANKYDELKNANDTIGAGDSAYDTMKAETLSANDSGCTLNDIIALVSSDKYVTGDYKFGYGICSRIFYNDGMDTPYRWFMQYNVYADYGAVVSGSRGKIECFKNDTQLGYYFVKSGASGEGDYRGLQYLGDELAALIDSSFTYKVPCSADLTLNSGTPTTDTQTVQDGNTYQIFETTDQKLYWDSDKLVFEIPIELPEKTADESTITGFKLTCEENPDYLTVATTPASE